ncbi:hypothetical protein HQN90_16450 [Paenibacillus alba]|uniref:hypothetical protein n=1 Tax=Paenibacillus alba TaxID=1197127 RepID=UPI0015678B46|nr:hypothetical protein [Paenibacillus alba]NQX67712.1 hypothetical protein [Paenibacillus alba]
MVVLFIILLAGILLFFVVKPPYTEYEAEEAYEQTAAPDLSMSDIAYIKRMDV